MNVATRTILRSLSTDAAILYARATDPDGRQPAIRCKAFMSDEEFKVRKRIVYIINKVIAHHVKSHSPENCLWLKKETILKLGLGGAKLGSDLLKCNFINALTRDLVHVISVVNNELTNQLEQAVTALVERLSDPRRSAIRFEAETIGI